MSCSQASTAGGGSQGTRLTVTESGFDDVPLARRAQAYRMNSDGWEWQMKSIESYVARPARA